MSPPHMKNPNFFPIGNAFGFFIFIDEQHPKLSYGDCKCGTDFRIKLYNKKRQGVPTLCRLFLCSYYSTILEVYTKYGMVSIQNQIAVLRYFVFLSVGNFTAIVVPFSELSSTRISPPCSVTISQTSDSPNPTPPFSLLRDLSTRKNG